MAAAGQFTQLRLGGGGVGLSRPISRIAATFAPALMLSCAIGVSSEAVSGPYQTLQPNAAVTLRGKDLDVSNVGQTELYVDGERLGDEQPDIWFGKTPLERGDEYKLATGKVRAMAIARLSGNDSKNVPFEIYLSGPHRDSRFRLKGYLQISVKGGVVQITPMEFQVVNQSW